MKKYVADTIEERKALAASTLPKPPAAGRGKGSFSMIPALLKTALFSSAARGPRALFVDYTALPSAQFRVRYKGEELRQDDLRVLLALIKRNAGKPAANAVKLTPRTFCREELGWSDSSDSADKLKASLLRMYDARVQVDGPGFLGAFALVSEVSMAGDAWHVSLGATIGEAMPKHPTYLNVVERLGMKDGLESWLYGYIKADACYAPIDRAELRELSGCTYEQKDFNKHLGALLEAFVARGVIHESTIVRRKLVIRKAPALH